jgi:hypothetical protein
MSDEPTLSVGGRESRPDDGPVPTPRAPGDADAWYAPDVVAQYEVGTVHNENNASVRPEFDAAGHRAMRL